MTLQHVYSTFRQFVDSTLRTAIDAAAGKPVTIFLDNQDVESVEAGPWIKITALPGSHEQASIGAGLNLFRKTGAFVFQVFDDFGSGDERLVAVCDAIASSLLANSTIQNVVYRPAVPVRVGRAGKYWQMNVTLPWQHDTRA